MSAPDCVPLTAAEKVDVPSSAAAADDDVFELSREALDVLPFGVITLDRAGTVQRFNHQQEALSHRRTLQTVGLSFFNDVAPCANVQAFRGRFDAFAAHDDSGVERFMFSFAFRWGRQDVAITMLRKAGHENINVLIHGRARALDVLSELSADLGPDAAPQARTDAVRSPSLLAAQELPRPIISVLDATDQAPLRRRVHPDDIAAVSATIAAAARDRTGYATEYRGVSAGAERRIFQETGYFEPGSERWGPTTTTITTIDVTEQRQLYAETRRAAYYDHLTGLPNEQLLLLRMADAVREAETNGRITAVLIANINRFRDVNDTFDYETGDAVLRAVALRLGECVRYGDTVARIAADSFVVLLTDIETPQSAGDTASNLIATVAQPLMIDECLHYLALRVGISLAPYDGRDPVPLLRAAETASVAAKGAGRNAMRFYSRQHKIDAVKNLQLQTELQRGLENDEFELVYQAQVDVKRDRVVAAEALVRWNHPTRGLVSPLDFIPLADRTGLIVPLGEWVLRTACRQARAWADRGFDLRVCVNVSAVQFQSPDFVDLVAAVVGELGLAPDRLELELTESILVEGFTETMETLTRLKALGLRLAIDDFGTGYSSLSYLKYFPVDTLKIDRAFIIDIVSDEFDQAIATAIFVLTKSLELECVVEGVETEEQLGLLTGIGCTVVQGYYFCKPSTPEKLVRMLAASTGAAGLDAASRQDRSGPPPSLDPPDRALPLRVAG